MTQPVSAILKAQLFDTPIKRAFALLDGASEPALIPEIEKAGLATTCLLRGELDTELYRAAPHLLELDADHPLTDWLLTESFGKHWGIFILTNANSRTLRQHCRALLSVYDPDGEPLFFSYYDPRVLRIYLPTCNARELDDFFGVCKRFIAEDSQNNRLQRFELTDQGLNTDLISVPPLK